MTDLVEPYVHYKLDTNVTRKENIRYDFIRPQEIEV